MDLFKEQPSNNRVDLLNFLSTKPNIKIMNDKEGQTLKSWITKTKKRVKWEPEVIVYYFLSNGLANSMWPITFLIFSGNVLLIP